MDLTSRQRRTLRGLAQDLKAQLFVGHQGGTPGVLSSLEDLFRGRELVKGRVLPSCPSTAIQVASELAAASGAAQVATIGRTFILFRPNPDIRDRIDIS